MIYFLQQSHLKKASVQKSNITWDESTNVALHSDLLEVTGQTYRILKNDRSLGVTQIHYLFKHANVFAYTYLL